MNRGIKVLVAARELIADKDKWCKGTMAVNSHDMPVSPSDKTAVKHCAVGAIRAQAHILDMDPDPALDSLREALPKSITSATYFNDAHKHKDVIALFDKAIKKARSFNKKGAT